MGKTLGYGEITVANVTEPFTVMLTNEAQQFATDSNRKVTSAQSYYTDIIVIRGSQERTDYTIGNITSGSGITVSKNSKRVTFSVSAGTTIGADAGVIEIPITLDGQTVKKQFSWSCGKQGPQGVKGQDGNSFAWNMLSETNCGKKHWGTESSGGKYSVEDFITEDNIDAVKLICTEAISTSNWSYVSFKDIKMLKQLKPSTKYTLSYDIKANRSGAISHSICKGDVSNFCTNIVVVNNIIGNETWQHISVVLTTNDLKTTPTNEILYLGRNALSKVGYSIIKNLKLVEGDIDTPWSPSQSDIEGKGVVETVQYYLATSQASGVTSSTSGWSTDITTQKLTADKKYLWNCYQTKYSDGTSEPISTPKVIGVYGDKGQNAKNLSITPSSQYFKSTDGGKTFAPNTITIKPTIQGEINFGKWQYSIDGGVSFADAVSGQKGLMISNNVLTVSKDSSLYSDAVTMITFRAVADDSSFYDTCSIAKIYDVSDIGDGRNLWITRDNITLQACEKDKYIYTTTGTSAVCIGATGSSVGTNTIALQTGTKYTISFVISSPSDVGDVMWYFCTALNGTGVKNYGGYAVKLVADENIVSQTITVDTSCDAAGFVIYNLPTDCIIKDIQVEKGSFPTGWTPAPEDVQTAILSTKSEISDVSLKVDKNKQAIEQRVEKTTYQQDLNLVKGDISKANEGLNKWRYEIYPKSLFASEYQGKSTMDVFAKNTNLTPSQSVLINDTDLSIAWNYAENYIGYALTFAKFSAAKSVAITFAHDDGAHIYLNGKLIGGSDAYNKNGESLTLGFVKGWNCIEVVVNEGSSTEGFKLGTTLSALPECQLMNCYYGTPVARQSHITNQLVENTTNIDGISTKVSKVTSVIGEGGENFTSFKNEYSDFKQTMNGFKTTVGQTYVTKDDFNGLEIGGRNLLVQKNITEGYLSTDGKGSFVGSGGGDQTSDWIDVSGNKYITITLYEDFTNTNNSGRYCEYDADKNCISTIDYNPRQKSSVIIELKSNTKYIRVTAIECKTRRYKIEKGNKATDWTPAPEDVNGKIVNATSIAQQAADKFSWIVKSGTSSSNFEITDRLMNLVSANINLDGVVSFMNTAKGDGRKNLYNLDYSSFENVASQEDAICYAKDNGVTSVGIDSSVSYDGDKSLKISYTTANLNSSTTPLYLGSSANNYGCVKIQAGKQYILSCYVKSDSTTGLFMIDIQGHDTPDTKTDGLYLSNIDPRKLPGSSTGVNLSTDWQRAVCAIKVADNATGLYWSVVPLIWGKPSSSSAPKTFNVWVDCIMLEEVDSISNEPGTYIFDKETIIDGGSIKTDTITGNQILAGSITADKIATDAIKSHNYISSGGTQGSFLNLGDGSFTSPNLSWDSNGNLIAKNANLSGQITATKGTVGGWNIIPQELYYGQDDFVNNFPSGISNDATSSKGNAYTVAYQKKKNGSSFSIYAQAGGSITSFLSGNYGCNYQDLNLNTTEYYTQSMKLNKENIILSRSVFNPTPQLSNYQSDLYHPNQEQSIEITPGQIQFKLLYTDYGTTDFSAPTYVSSIYCYADGLGISTPNYLSLSAEYGVGISVTDPSKHNAIETTGDAIIGGNMVLRDRSDGRHKVAIYPYDGCIEMYGNTPYIDFHYSNSTSDYTSRIIAQKNWDCLTFTGSIELGADLYAGGYIYNSSGGHYTWKGRTDAYISCGDYNGHNVYYYANYHAFYVNKDSGQGMMYINTNGVTSRVGFTKTSDERIKKNFESFDDNIIDAYMNIEPVKYQLKQSSNDNYHFGFKAQHVDKVFSDYGDTYNESFDICTSRPIDPDKAKELYGVDDMTEEYGLRYDELIAPTTYMVQHTYKELESTKNELTKVKQEKADLEARLQAIEAKLGL